MEWSIFQFNLVFFPKLWTFSFRNSFEWISQCCATLSTFWNGPSRFQFKLVWLFLFSVPVITFKNGDRLTDIPKLHLKMNTEWLTLEIIHQCWKDRAGSREPFGSKNPWQMFFTCNDKCFYLASIAVLGSLAQLIQPTHFINEMKVKGKQVSMYLYKPGPL